MFSKMIIPILSNVQVEKPCGVEDRYVRKWKKYSGLGCIHCPGLYQQHSHPHHDNWLLIPRHWWSHSQPTEQTNKLAEHCSIKKANIQSNNQSPPIILSRCSYKVHAMCWAHCAVMPLYLKTIMRNQVGVRDIITLSLHMVSCSHPTIHVLI